MTQIDLEDWLTSSAEDTPASRSHKPGSASAIKMTDISGQRCLQLSRLSGPLGLLEKMLLDTSLWASTKCFLIWKQQTTPQGHLLFRLSPQMLRTDEIGSGLLHTPTATANQMAPSMNSGWWPTPDTRGFTNEGSLQLLAKNTETKEEFCAMSHRAGRKRHDKFFPTPTARDYKDNGSSPAELQRNSVTLETHAGGQLNPTWVEWLMGYPEGWTDLNS